MAGTATINIRTSFADDTFRDLKFGPLSESDTAVVNAKAKIKAFDPESVKNLYLSENGASCTGITQGSVVVTSEREINLNDD